MPGNIIAQIAIAPATNKYGKLGVVFIRGKLLIITALATPSRNNSARPIFQRLISLNNRKTVAMTKPKKNDQIIKG